jgi:hypothetical protein
LIACVVREVEAANAVFDQVVNDGSQEDGVGNYSGWKQTGGHVKGLVRNGRLEALQTTVLKRRG